MLKHKPFLQRSNVIVITLLLICLTFLSVGAWALKNQPRRESSSQVDNKTQALQLVELTRDEGTIKLLLKNISTKNIKGYTLSIGNIRMEEDFIYSERVISPNEVYEVDVPISKQSKSQGQKVNVLAVIFDDLSGDGDSASVTAIKDRRAGEKLQLERVSELIQGTLDSIDSSPQTTLRKLETQLDSLSENYDGNSSQALRDGLHNGKEEALQATQRLEQSEQITNATKLREALSKLKERNKDKVAKL